MGVRDGRQFLDGLRDRPREVWGRRRVEDVTVHPALAPAARELANLYDMQRDPRYQDVPSYVLPSGERAR